MSLKGELLWKVQNGITALNQSLFTLWLGTTHLATSTGMTPTNNILQGGPKKTGPFFKVYNFFI